MPTPRAEPTPVPTVPAPTPMPTLPAPTPPQPAAEDLELLRDLELLQELDLLRDWDPAEDLPIPSGEDPK